MSQPEVDVGGGTVTPNVVAGTVRSMASQAGGTDTSGVPEPAGIPWIDDQGKFVKLTAAQVAALPPELRPLYEQTLALQPGQDGATKIDPDVVRATGAYVDIWGIEPPKGYIKSLVGQGMNPYEIRAHELSKLGPDGKPLAMKANYWRDQHSSYAAMAAQVFARRG